MIRVGLVGYGLAGATFHAPLIRACDRMELSAVQTSREAPGRVGSFDELLDRSNLVVIASPNQTHYQLARDALSAGRHVVVDKPFALTVEEADRLMALAREQQRVLTVFQNRRLDGDFLTVAKLLPKLGDIALFEANWDRFRPTIKQGWREFPQPGGGVLADLGAHLIDHAIQLFGLPDAIEADVLAQRSEARVDDYFELVMHYGRMRACLRCSTLVAEPRARFAIHGSGGSFTKFGIDVQEAQLKAGMDPRDPGFGIDDRDGSFTTPDGTRTPITTQRGRYLNYYEAVASAILDGTPVPVDPADARNGLILIDLARRSAALGKRLLVPAE
ncbi:Gfo/Idh/MocA family oxidoreductase [Sphingomonas sp.]|uniref:Gfo/Idh/MocA family oxidoreductase n=1 Tax=Sphingomonas sp. TaxID=28214 RepID=UPI0025D53718|nr:Gfo/Idh/MocA family oxidoreductase [Sphingomonas sp.]MBV9528462.1 Gfo/Idh/MocA family oxidoreductase [Sphingomonas sp.]